MASLIPTFSYTPNTAAASNAYIAAQSKFSDSLMDPINLLSKLNNEAIAAKEREEERATRDEERAWKLEDRKIAQAERDRVLNKETATNEALKAVLDPKAYKQEKMSAEQQAIESGLANLSPEDRALAEQQLKNNYNKRDSSSQWLANVLGNVNADQSKILSTKKNVYDIAVSTPGTPEYNAKVAADRDEKMWALNAQAAKQREATDYANRLAENLENAKIKSMMNVLSVSGNTEKDIVANQALIKNIGDKQEVFGTEYVKEIEKKKPQIDSITKIIEKVESDINKSNIFGPERTEGLQKALEMNKTKLAAIEEQAKNVALGKAGMGATLQELPTPKVEKVKQGKTKEEFTRDVFASLGDTPTMEAVALAGQEIAKRYPDSDKSIDGWNELARQYGGKAVSTSNADVAKENAQAAIRLKQLLAGKNKASEFGKVDKTHKTALDIFDKYGSPDVIGSGQEIDILNKIYSIKAEYDITDDQMQQILNQSSTQYRDSILPFGVDHTGFLDQIEEKAKVYSKNK